MSLRISRLFFTASLAVLGTIFTLAAQESVAQSSTKHRTANTRTPIETSTAPETAADRAEEEARRARIAAALASPTIKPVSDTASQAKPDAKEASQAAPAVKEQRLALVIGNSNYKQGPLVNPVNDARAMAIRLQQLG